MRLGRHSSDLPWVERGARSESQGEDLVFGELGRGPVLGAHVGDEFVWEGDVVVLQVVGEVGGPEPRAVGVEA